MALFRPHSFVEPRQWPNCATFQVRNNSAQDWSLSGEAGSAWRLLAARTMEVATIFSAVRHVPITYLRFARQSCSTNFFLCVFVRKRASKPRLYEGNRQF